MLELQASTEKVCHTHVFLLYTHHKYSGSGNSTRTKNRSSRERPQGNAVLALEYRLKADAFVLPHKALANTSSSKDDLSRLRAEMKKLYDGLDIGLFTLLTAFLNALTQTSLKEFLNLRSHVWGIREYETYMPETSLIKSWLRTRCSVVGQERQHDRASRIITVKPNIYYWTT